MTKITYDPVARAMYIYVQPQGWSVIGTDDLDDNTTVDWGSHHVVGGIEILDADPPIIEIIGHALDSETSAVVKHGRAPTGATMRLDQSDFTIPTDEEIIAAIPVVSRKLYGHEGGGVDPYELALHLAPKPGCYGVACDEVFAHVTVRMRALARVGRVRKGDHLGRPFYRLGA